MFKAQDGLLLPQGRWGEGGAKGSPGSEPKASWTQSCQQALTAGIWPCFVFSVPVLHEEVSICSLILSACPTICWQPWHEAREQIEAGESRFPLHRQNP